MNAPVTRFRSMIRGRGAWLPGSVLGLAILLILATRSFYVLDETQVAWLTDPAGGHVVSSAGPHLKRPWQQLRRFDVGLRWKSMELAPARSQDDHVVRVTLLACWRLPVAGATTRAAFPEPDNAMDGHVRPIVEHALHAAIAAAPLADLVVAGQNPDPSPLTRLREVTTATARPLVRERLGLELLDLSIQRLVPADEVADSLYRAAEEQYRRQAGELLHGAGVDAGKLQAAAREAADRMVAEAAITREALLAEARREAGRIQPSPAAGVQREASLHRGLERTRLAVRHGAAVELEAGPEFFRLLGYAPASAAGAPQSATPPHSTSSASLAAPSTTSQPAPEPAQISLPASRPSDDGVDASLCEPCRS
ncbi:MAG: hypothetical protein AMXMBFR13_22300 [Phycisphaerae bacterium]